MKKIIIIIIVSLNNCQSFVDYFKYRSLDFRDMFTIGVEKNVAGGSFFVWCFGAGLQYGSQGEGYGLRGSGLGAYKTGYSGEIPPSRSYSVGKTGHNSPGGSPSTLPYFGHYGTSIIFENSLEQVNVLATGRRAKNKSYSVVNLFIYPKIQMVPIFDCDRDPEFCRLSKLGRHCDSPLQFEGSFGLYYGLRFGFNFYEALDFITGIFGVDILDDDTLEPMTEKDQRDILSEIHYETRGTRLAWMGETCSKDRICKEGLCVDGICQDKEIHKTKNWTGRFCNKHYPCRSGVCLDGVCMAREMEKTYPWKTKSEECGVEGAYCSYLTEFLDCGKCGSCVEGRCKWWE